MWIAVTNLKVDELWVAAGDVVPALREEAIASLLEAGAIEATEPKQLELPSKPAKSTPKADKA